jgi:hypothetical protein
LYDVRIIPIFYLEYNTGLHMKTWQYKFIDSNTMRKPGLMKDFSPSEVEAYLNQLGQEGWEIIHFQCKFRVKDVDSFYGVARREGTEPSQPAE